MSTEFEVKTSGKSENEVFGGVGTTIKLKYSVFRDLRRGISVFWGLS